MFTLAIVQLDQQRLGAFQAGDLLPVEGHAAGVGGLEQQLAAVEQLDLAAQAVAILQPDGIGQGRQGETPQQRKAQQGQRTHDGQEAGWETGSALSLRPASVQGAAAIRWRCPLGRQGAMLEYRSR
ncbi:hypothetical protein D3C78_1324090 [compost metagenome]